MNLPQAALATLVVSMLALVSTPSIAAARDGADCAESPGAVVADLKRAPDGRVAVDYRFATPVTCVRFSDASPIRAPSWHFENPDASLMVDGVTVVIRTPVTHLRVDIDDSVKDGQFDRVYTPMIRFKDGSSVAVYSEYLMMDRDFAATTLHVDAGDDAHGRASTPTFDSKRPRTYLVLGTPATRSFGEDAVVSDRSLPPALVSEIERAVGFAEADFGAMRLDQARTTLLIISDAHESSRTTWRGDTLAGLVRLDFSGPGWDAMSPELGRDVQHFVAHEMFHLVNAHVVDQSAGDGMLSLVEGSAEAAADFTLFRHGLLDRGQFDERREMAVKLCMRIAGATLSEKERNNVAQAPYACGDALANLLASATGASGAEPNDYFRLWALVRKRTGSGDYGWPDVFAAARSLSAPNADAALHVLEDIVDSRTSWDDGLHALQQAGLLKAVDSDEARKPWRSEYFAGVAISRMLGARCRARRGYTRVGDVYQLDAPAESCEGVPDGFALVSIAGHRLADDGLAAVQALGSECATRGDVEIADKAGLGRQVACGPMPSTPQFYRFVR